MTIAEIEGLVMEHKFAEARTGLLGIMSVLPQDLVNWVMAKIWEAEMGRAVLVKQNLSREEKTTKAREMFHKLFKEVA